MAGMTVTEGRLQSVDFSTSYATGIQSVIVPEDSAITSVDDLFAEGANHKVGVQLGTTGDIYCTGDIQDAGLGEVVQFNNGTDAVLALTTGKVDCVVIDNEPAKKYVEANEGLKMASPRISIAAKWWWSSGRPAPASPPFCAVSTCWSCPPAEP